LPARRSIEQSQALVRHKSPLAVGLPAQTSAAFFGNLDDY
jgi:hypothetical protein